MRTKCFLFCFEPHQFTERVPMNRPFPVSVLRSTPCTRLRSLVHTFMKDMTESPPTCTPDLFNLHHLKTTDSQSTTEIGETKQLVYICCVQIILITVSDFSYPKCSSVDPVVFTNGIGTVRLLHLKLRYSQDTSMVERGLFVRNVIHIS